MTATLSTTRRGTTGDARGDGHLARSSTSRRHTGDAHPPRPIEAPARRGAARRAKRVVDAVAALVGLTLLLPLLLVVGLAVRLDSGGPALGFATHVCASRLHTLRY